MWAMYMTTASVILGGTANMVFCTTPLYKKNRKPIDRGKCLKDGKRLFGDNKTVIGFISMLVFTMIFQVISGLVDLKINISEMYAVHENTVIFNLFAGFLLGLGYMLFELPNSFIKRRMNIAPGSTNYGLNFIIDQADSMFGISLVIYLISDISLVRAIQYVLLGSITHIAINLILKLFGIRRNI